MTDYVKYNHLYFRVDMNDEIATGHVMRCLSISDEIQKLLVVSSGVDPYHVIEHILSTLDIEKYDFIDAICGACSEDYDKLDSIYSKVPSVHLHRPVSN